MRKLHCATLSIIVLLSLGACVHTQATMLGGAHYAPVPQSEVRVFASMADLEGIRYEKVALIHAQGSSSMTSEAKMIEAARRKAAAIGANAIVLSDNSIQEASAGAKVAGAFLGTGTQRRGEITAIRILSDGETASPEHDLPLPDL